MEDKSEKKTVSLNTLLTVVSFLLALFIALLTFIYTMGKDTCEDSKKSSIDKVIQEKAEEIANCNQKVGMLTVMRGIEKDKLNRFLDSQMLTEPMVQLTYNIKPFVGNILLMEKGFKRKYCIELPILIKNKGHRTITPTLLSIQIEGNYGYRPGLRSHTISDGEEDSSTYYRIDGFIPSSLSPGSRGMALWELCKEKEKNSGKLVEFKGIEKIRGMYTFHAEDYLPLQGEFVLTVDATKRVKK